jgi:hypothetical protein
VSLVIFSSSTVLFFDLLDLLGIAFELFKFHLGGGCHVDGAANDAGTGTRGVGKMYSAGAFDDDLLKLVEDLVVKENFDIPPSLPFAFQCAP